MCKHEAALFYELYDEPIVDEYDDEYFCYRGADPYDDVFFRDNFHLPRHHSWTDLEFLHIAINEYVNSLSAEELKLTLRDILVDTLSTSYEKYLKDKYYDLLEKANPGYVIVEKLKKENLGIRREYQCRD